MPNRLRTITACILLTGCAATASAPTPPPATAPTTTSTRSALADITVQYRGVTVSSTQILARLDQRATVDITTDDGHTSVLDVLIREESAGLYRTTVDVIYDGASIASTELLSNAGQRASVESSDVQVTLRVSAGA